MRGSVKLIVDAYDGPYFQYSDCGEICGSSTIHKITGYLFCSDHVANSMSDRALVIRPFRLTRGRRAFLLQKPFNIDLRGIEPDLYQVHLVQDFWTDDDNPNLDECLAGIFLARRRPTGEWEMPERWQIECRSLMVLGTIDTRQGPHILSAPDVD